jgi:hypothetical protein
VPKNSGKRRGQGRGQNTIKNEDNLNGQFQGSNGGGKRTYEWDEERTRLIRKSDRAIVAEILKTNGVWVAKNTSGKTKPRIGDYESPAAAREGVEREFGLRLPREG